MNRYAVLDKNQEIIELVRNFNWAVECAHKNSRACFVRPVDEEATQEDECEIIVDFGNCSAFAIR